HFTADIGYVTAPDIAALKSKPQFDEIVDLARFTNLLQHYTGDAGYREMAKHAMKFVCVPEGQSERGFSVGGLLLADREMAAAPLHITIVGSKNNATAGALFHAALKLSSSYKRVEWLDTREGALPNGDVEYPTLSDPAAFICSEKSCSPPAFSPDELTQAVRKNLRLLSAEQGQ
ncbi:MAG: hypothetical protein JO333_17315, partial [Verrucomicrobia bacterium]|nr:hypothetical protein [Verrucomicrobiota bacterium]